MIRSNLKEVMNNHNPNLSVRQLSEDIDHGFETVRKMNNDAMKQYPKDLLDKLCKYFDCGIEDLIKFEKD